MVQQSESKLLGKISPVYDHAVMKGANAIAARGLKKVRNKCVDHAAEACVEHPERKRHGVAKMLEPGFVNIFKM